MSSYELKNKRETDGARFDLVKARFLIHRDNSRIHTDVIPHTYDT